jgi:hypothetical protein
MTRTFLGCPCADCGIGTLTIGEYYIVHDHVWEQAWAGRRKPWHGADSGQEILCIGCLEHRIGRTLMRCDFDFTPEMLRRIAAPVNDPEGKSAGNSDRLQNRLTTEVRR